MNAIAFVEARRFDHWAPSNSRRGFSSRQDRMTWIATVNVKGVNGSQCF
jgi:hypothetical protein